MKVGRLKRPEERVDVSYLGALNIKMYGRLNLYPQELHDIVYASPAGRRCFERKADYIEGNGLASQALSEAVCNAFGEMVDDIHSHISRDLALYDGFALHVNYNILGEITSLAHVPFENCRLEEDDDAGVVAHIAVHPDWTGLRRTRGGKTLRVSRSMVRYFPVFNPDPRVVADEIAAAGGIERYCGQVLYMTMAGANRYCVPEHDAVVTDMSTDEGISNVCYRNVRNSFLPAAVIWTLKSARYPMAVEGESAAENARAAEDGEAEFFESVERMQGDMHACKIITCSGEREEEKPEVIPIPMNNYDKQFEDTRREVTENIYAAFGQEQFFRLRSGSLGFSGEIAHDAKSEYCEVMTGYQRLMRRCYVSIFSRWSKADPLPYGGPGDAEVEPLLRSVNSTAATTEGTAV